MDAVVVGVVVALWCGLGRLPPVWGRRKASSGMRSRAGAGFLGAPSVAVCGAVRSALSGCGEGFVGYGSVAGPLVVAGCDGRGVEEPRPVG